MSFGAQVDEPQHHMKSTYQIQSANKWNPEYDQGSSALKNYVDQSGKPLEASHRFGLPYPVPGPIPPHSLSHLITGDVAEASRGLGDDSLGFRVPGEEIYDSALPHLDHWAASPDPWQPGRFGRRIVFPAHGTQTSLTNAHEEHLPSQYWPQPYAFKKYPDIDVPVSE